MKNKTTLTENKQNKEQTRYYQTQKPHQPENKVTAQT
jgi:hypothetical protein